MLHFGKKLVLIGGTRYAGEMKKSIFTALNYLLPAQGVMPMHCSANVGPDGDTALFFGLSGTGKTTLSADPDPPAHRRRRARLERSRRLQLRGRLLRQGDPALGPRPSREIYAATRMFGTVLENVVLDPATRAVDFDADQHHREHPRLLSRSTTSRTTSRAARAGIRRNIVFLTADAFGVLPPIARLTPEQAMYHFLSGYTAKVAGTERGVTEPTATFSACFGAPFLPLHPSVYARMLGERIARHGAQVWLVNTGWTGGPVRRRVADEARRTPGRWCAPRWPARSTAPASSRTRSSASRCPTACPTCPPACSTPRSTWADPAAYDAQARKLAADVPRELRAVPRAGAGGRGGGAPRPSRRRRRRSASTGMPRDFARG